MTHLLFTLFGAGLLVVTLPLVVELALVTSANLLPARRKQAPELPDLSESAVAQLDLAIIVPAHNEEFLVSRCIASLLASLSFSQASATRIFVVAHNCVDGTAAKAAESGAEVLVFNDPAAKGKGFALRHGFEHAIISGAAAVMVIDADSIVSANTVGAVRSALGLNLPAEVQIQSPATARVAQCRYQMESTTSKSSTRLSALAFRGFNVIRPRGRARLGFSAGILGNGFAIATPVLRAIPYDAFSLVEDLEYHLHLVMAGERVRYLDHAVVSADFPESRTGEAQQRSRWEGGRLHTARQWALPLMGKILAGRPRLIEPLCDLAGLPLAYGVFALLVAACIPLPWMRWYAALSLAVVMAHVLAAAAAGPDFVGTLKLLALSPLYILRKLWMIPGVIRGSSGKADWVRTERDNTL